MQSEGRGHSLCPIHRAQLHTGQTGKVFPVVYVVALTWEERSKMTRRAIWEARRNTRKSPRVSQNKTRWAPSLCQELFQKLYGSLWWQAFIKAVITSIFKEGEPTVQRRWQLAHRHTDTKEHSWNWKPRPPNSKASGSLHQLTLLPGANQATFLRLPVLTYTVGTKPFLRTPRQRWPWKRAGELESLGHWELWAHVRGTHVHTCATRGIRCELPVPVRFVAAWERGKD